MNGEAPEARAAIAVVQAELAGKSNVVFFEIQSICILMRVVLISTLLLHRRPGAIGYHAGRDGRTAMGQLRSSRVIGGGHPLVE